MIGNLPWYLNCQCIKAPMVSSKSLTITTSLYYYLLNYEHTTLIWAHQYTQWAQSLGLYIDEHKV